MKLLMPCSVVLLVALLSSSPHGGTDAFRAYPYHAAMLRRRRATNHHVTSLFSSPSPKELMRIMEEEAANPTALVDSVVAMKKTYLRKVGERPHDAQRVSAIIMVHSHIIFAVGAPLLLSEHKT